MSITNRRHTASAELPSFTEFSAQQKEQEAQVAQEAKAVEATTANKEAPFTNGPADRQRFIVRVVLHRTDGNGEYEELHEAMQELGFEKFINGTNTGSSSSGSHKLPGGLYYHDRGYFLNPFREKKLQEGYEEVKKVVKAVVDANPTLYKANTPPSIFIAEVNMALWSGLDEAPRK